MDINMSESMTNTNEEEQMIPSKNYEGGSRAAAGSVQRGNGFDREIAELMELYPELREKMSRGEALPREVMTACAKSGISLRTAYAEYEAKRAKADAEQLRKAVKILRQNAAAAAKAPVKGSAADSGESKGKDPFLEGLLSED